MKPSSSTIWEEFVIWIGGSKVEIFYVIKTKYFKWAIPGLFFLYFCLFNAVDSKMFNLIVIADDWIRTTILWTRKRRSTNWATTTAQLKQNIQISKGQKNLFIILSFHPKPSIIIFVQLNSTHPFLIWIRLKCAIFTKNCKILCHNWFLSDKHHFGSNHCFPEAWIINLKTLVRGMCRCIVWLI